MDCRIPPIAEAKAAGLDSVEWMFDSLRKAIKEQKNSPHKILMLKGGHVPTNKEVPLANDGVDEFICKAMSPRTPYPFEKDAKAR